MRQNEDTAKDDANRLEMAETYIAAKKWGSVRLIAGSIRDETLKAQLQVRIVELEAADAANTKSEE